MDGSRITLRRLLAVHDGAIFPAATARARATAAVGPAGRLCPSEHVVTVTSIDRAGAGPRRPSGRPVFSIAAAGGLVVRLPPPTTRAGFGRRVRLPRRIPFAAGA